ncbi:hypothetical protein ACFWV1_26220 [Streptomyces sp. NPDC058700]|uniref:hypothetical protein n=1 Tax=Streptomyces sp. NPDC058700 TaxID=3346607 RepID=UPI003665B81D
MTTPDPTKHLQGYGRRNPETGMVHSHIRHPDGQPPTPFGCRWCGTEQSGHGRRWKPGHGMHPWEQPTPKQILARMRARRTARRTARLNAPPAQHHATTGLAPDETGESPIEYCADCRTDGCARWARIQARLDRQRWGLESTAAPGGWGSAVWPF